MRFDKEFSRIRNIVVVKKREVCHYVGIHLSSLGRIMCHISFLLERFSSFILGRFMFFIFHPWKVISYFCGVTLNIYLRPFGQEGSPCLGISQNTSFLIILSKALKFSLHNIDCECKLSMSFFD